MCVCISNNVLHFLHILSFICSHFPLNLRTASPLQRTALYICTYILWHATDSRAHTQGVWVTFSNISTKICHHFATFNTHIPICTYTHIYIPHLLSTPAKCMHIFNIKKNSIFFCNFFPFFSQFILWSENRSKSWQVGCITCIIFS